MLLWVRTAKRSRGPSCHRAHPGQAPPLRDTGYISPLNSGFIIKLALGIISIFLISIFYDMLSWSSSLFFYCFNGIETEQERNHFTWEHFFFFGDFYVMQLNTSSSPLYCRMYNYFHSLGSLVPWHLNMRWKHRFFLFLFSMNFMLAYL